MRAEIALGQADGVHNALQCVEFQRIHADDNRNIDKYCDPTSPEYANLVEEIRQRIGVDSLKFNTLDTLEKAIGLPKCEFCTHCFDGSSYGY